jgi:regulator of RNase E activity RraA
MEWRTDEELFKLCRNELFTAVIGDCMDQAGYLNQFLPPAVQPLRRDMVVVGRAMPVLEADDHGGEGEDRVNPSIRGAFGLMLRALDDLKPGEVYICAGASPQYALWGELMTQCARNRGATGAVVDGYSRDTRGILEQDFPVFSHGRYAQDQRPRGKVVDFRCRIRFGEVTVNSGDLIFGDLDGVCVVPREIETDILIAAFEKARGERKVLEAIRAGCGAQEAWDTYGIL